MLLQVEKTQQAVKKEQSLATKLKDEIKAVSSSTDKQMQLEQQKVQATEKERAMTEKALQAERQKVSCMSHTSAPDVNLSILALLSANRHDLTCPTLLCPALPCSTLPCSTLPCHAQPCAALCFHAQCRVLPGLCCHRLSRSCISCLDLRCYILVGNCPSCHSFSALMRLPALLLPTFYFKTMLCSYYNLHDTHITLYFSFSLLPLQLVDSLP